jgi:phosphoribosylformylglycinamidine cyclo-ligase
MADNKVDHVNYDVLDRAKLAFIEAGKRTAGFASRYGFIPDERFGSSANVFSLDLRPFLKLGAENLSITLIPEGLGTADDARPDDLTPAEAERFWFNIGTKSVAVMTNDAASSGMQTILIGLYLPSATPELVFNESFMTGFLNGFVEGCRTVGCVYFSGETPQLKNKLYPGKLDIAGALFGLMPPGVRPVDGSALAAGDQIVLFESSGPHENGFTALRKLSEKLPQGYRTPLSDGRPYWEAINAGSKLYTPIVQAVLAAGIVPSGIENITGHGWQKIMRSKKALRYRIRELPAVPEVFTFVEKHAGMTPAEMIRIFNYGAGLAMFLKDRDSALRTIELGAGLGLKGVLAGDVEEAPRREVVVEPLSETIRAEEFVLGK